MTTSSLLTLLVLALSAVSLNAERCFILLLATELTTDEVAQGSLVVVHYNVIGGVRGHSGVSMSITDPLHKFLKQDANIDTSSDDIHKFSFTADAGGNFAVCFVNSNDKPVRVMLDFKHGVEAKDYTELAKREHLMPVEKAR
ncbi:Putative plasma membrane protein [Phytophthora palmivora]|uniref:Plasma membrane protein n=1 Tax=Phytophthora palmivora TaxID=4796 RepID=A0A2P4YSS8_9STRA|nr:Putative plasma membrane protein [Phytophthora palmivora]